MVPSQLREKAKDTGISKEDMDNAANGTNEKNDLLKLIVATWDKEAEWIKNNPDCNINGLEDDTWPNRNCSDNGEDGCNCTFCTNENPCNPNPCQNDGTCTPNITDKTFKCSCNKKPAVDGFDFHLERTIWEGDTCEICDPMKGGKIYKAKDGLPAKCVPYCSSNGLRDGPLEECTELTLAGGHSTTTSWRKSSPCIYPPDKKIPNSCAYKGNHVEYVEPKISPGYTGAANGYAFGGFTGSDPMSFYNRYCEYGYTLKDTVGPFTTANLQCKQKQMMMIRIILINRKKKIFVIV